MGVRISHGSLAFEVLQDLVRRRRWTANPTQGWKCGLVDSVGSCKEPLTEVRLHGAVVGKPAERQFILLVNLTRDTMAYPAAFDKSNVVLERPPTMTADECEPLNAFVGVQQDGLRVIISCFKVTAEELAEIQKTGRIWLAVYGQAMMPVSISGHSPFVGEK